mgnify:CR=1 FL=1
MSISAAQVKELRERTGAGMMECKKALGETNGDLDTAIEWLRKNGLAKADKKAGRTAAEGMIAMKIAADGKRAVMVEVNSETDFVARREEFQGFANNVAQRVFDATPGSLDELLALPYAAGGKVSINEARQEQVAKIGENIGVRRFSGMRTDKGVIGGYSHGLRIGVLVELEGGTMDLAKDIAMHVAASRPLCVSPADVPADVIAKEKEIYMAQAQDSGKPKEIIEKMVMGRVNKYLKEATLLGQPFVKNPDITVEQLCKEAKAKVIRFERFEVGEGIEKKSANFAEEVMAQVRGS